MFKVGGRVCQGETMRFGHCCCGEAGNRSSSEYFTWRAVVEGGAGRLEHAYLYCLLVVFRVFKMGQ